jgi:glycosyltransferase involved in cell wall biosynthesis
VAHDPGAPGAPGETDKRRVAVAIDVTPLVGVRTGIGVALAETLTAIRALDDAPHVVPYALSWRAWRSRRDGAAPADARIVPIPATALLHAWGRVDLPRVDRWLRPANVVHATNYLAPPSRLPTLVTVNDCSFVRHPELCTPEVRAFAPAVRRAVARGATVHTTSEFVAAEVEDLFGPGLRAAQRIVVVPFGVPGFAAAPRLADDVADSLGGEPYVLSIGTLEPRKNLPRVVAAFGLVASAHQRLRLVLAGPDGPGRPDVDRAIAALPPALRGRVLLTGAVDDATRHALLRGATVVAYPSLYEGFGFPALEAMACRVPVVTAASGALPEVVGDAALLVDPTDVDAIAAAVGALLADEAQRAALVARGAARAEQFSWHRTATGLAATYARLAA